MGLREPCPLKRTPDTPKIGNGLVQLITMDGSTRQIWVNQLKRFTLDLMLIIEAFKATS